MSQEAKKDPGVNTFVEMSFFSTFKKILLTYEMVYNSYIVVIKLEMLIFAYQINVYTLKYIESFA